MNLNQRLRVLSRYWQSTRTSTVSSLILPHRPTMDHAFDLIDAVCRTHQYCPSKLELQEAAAVTAIASGMLLICCREMTTRATLVSYQHDLLMLKDDMFDNVVLALYGLILLILAGLSMTYELASLQPDVIGYIIVLGTVALKARNSVTSGVTFTTLSYSSWYGIFRLFFTMPISHDYRIVFTYQWMAAIIAATGPALIGNLKYPALMQSSMALVVFGSVVLSLLIAGNASAVFIDLLLLKYNVFPSYAGRITSGENYRLYGRGLSLLERAGYYGMMVAIQLVSVRVPHFLCDEDALRGQLREQLAEAQLQQRELQRQRVQQLSRERRNGQVKPNDADPAIDDDGGIIDADHEGISTDLPADCVEVTAEEAIRLQERGFAAHTVAPNSAVDGDAFNEAAGETGSTGSAGGVRKRKT